MDDEEYSRNKCVYQYHHIDEKEGIHSPKQLIGLPHDVLLRIFSYFDEVELILLGLVCKRFTEIVQEPVLWSMKWLQLFPPMMKSLYQIHREERKEERVEIGTKNGEENYSHPSHCSSISLIQSVVVSRIKRYHTTSSIKEKMCLSCHWGSTVLLLAQLRNLNPTFINNNNNNEEEEEMDSNSTSKPYVRKITSKVLEAAREALVIACSNGYLPCVRIFLDWTPGDLLQYSLILSSSNKTNKHPIYEAAKSGHWNIVYELLDHWVLHNDSRNLTQAEFLYNKHEIYKQEKIMAYYACMCGHIKTLQYLINECSWSPNDEIFLPYSKCTLRALHVACKQEQVPISRLLIAHKANVNARALTRDIPDTPIHVATEVGNIELVKLLIDAHSDVNAKTTRIVRLVEGQDKTEFGLTPVMLAVGICRLDIVKLLVYNGASVLESGSMGTALDISLSTKKTLQDPALISFLEKVGREEKPIISNMYVLFVSSLVVFLAVSFYYLFYGYGYK